MRIWREYEARGYSTLALAFRDLEDDEAHTVTQVRAERELTLLCIIALHAPMKPDAYEAVKRCSILGVEARLLTGTGPFRSAAVARAAGILPHDGAIDPNHELDSHELVLSRELGQLAAAKSGRRRTRAESVMAVTADNRRDCVEGLRCACQKSPVIRGKSPVRLKKTKASF